MIITGNYTFVSNGQTLKGKFEIITPLKTVYPDQVEAVISEMNNAQGVRIVNELGMPFTGVWVDHSLIEM